MAGSFGGMTEYQRQSWRDNFNGGRAAGDWSGSVNARLDRERAVLGGFNTVSGSSWQDENRDHFAASSMSAAEWADSGNARAIQEAWAANHVVQVVQQPAGPGLAYVSDQATATTGPSQGRVSDGPVTTTGPGAAAVVQKTSSGKLTFGTGPGNPFFGAPPMEAGRKDKATGGFAGTEVHANPYFTNVEDFWEPRYGEPGEWLGGLINIGADAIYNVPGVLNKLGVSRDTPYLGADWRPNIDYQEMPGLPPVERRPRR